MLEIDVRKTPKEQVTVLRYGDEHGDVVRYGYEEVYVAQSKDGAVKKEDIDNLIEALKTAKELWS